MDERLYTRCPKCQGAGRNHHDFDMFFRPCKGVGFIDTGFGLGDVSEKLREEAVRDDEPEASGDHVFGIAIAIPDEPGPEAPP